MGEETRMTMSEYEGGGSGGDADEERVSEWELGLPSADDLTPLSQPLIPIELASAFSISPEPPRTAVDVNRASQKTVSTLRGSNPRHSHSSNYKPFDDDEEEVVEIDDGEDGGEGEGSESRKSRKVDSPEEADSALRIESEDPGSGRVSAGSSAKRPRLVWTPQLHKRFVDVVGHLGIKNAVPKTIMQLMNVEGLTRENVASHLQKYRLYLKRMQGLSPNEGPSSATDQLFASTPVPKSLHESGGGAGSGAHQNGNGQQQQHHMPISIPMPYPPPMMPMHMYGHMSGPAGGFHGFESHPSYGMMQQHKYGSMVSYPHNVVPNEK